MRLLLFVKECGEWGWMCEAPPSRKTGKGSSESVQKRKQLSIQQRLLKGEIAYLVHWLLYTFGLGPRKGSDMGSGDAEFGCGVCRKVLQQPLSMPCGHNFCKPCLDGAFGQQSTRERTGVSGRPLRTQKVMKRCPTCNADISDYLITPQVIKDEMAYIVMNDTLYSLIVVWLCHKSEAKYATWYCPDKSADGGGHSNSAGHTCCWPFKWYKWGSWWDWRWLQTRQAAFCLWANPMQRS